MEPNINQSPPFKLFLNLLDLHRIKLPSLKYKIVFKKL